MRAGSTPSVLDEGIADVAADRDHDPAAPERGAVDAAAVRELAAREELGEGLVLEVVERRCRRRRLHHREHHADRKVDRVQLAQAQPPADVAGRGRGQSEPEEAAGPCAGGRELADDDRGEAASRVRRRPRHEGPVLERRPPVASACASSSA